MLYLGHPTVTNATNEKFPSVLSLEARTCPRCGLTETLLRTEGLLGCTTCYETFEDLVVLAVAALQGVTITPNNVPADLAPETPTPVIVPAPRKTLSWLPRRTKSGPSSAANLSDTPRKEKRSRSEG
jgi:hypothetical protein